MSRYLAGIYARLSVEHHDGKDESIEAQIQIAEEYISEHSELSFCRSYTDSGKTGTNFERGGFLRMMEDVQSGIINCIIVKDFSRLGRNYIETGNYIENIFPSYGVRFISVTDHYDSLEEKCSAGEWTFHLKNIVNELYAKDISIKVRASKKAKQKQGSYTGGRPPYGYIIGHSSGRRLLFPEEGTKEVVRAMFQLCDEGKSLREIAAWLYEEGVHTPTAYRLTGHIRRMEEETLTEWPRGTIKSLLTNPAYAGVSTQEDSERSTGIRSRFVYEAIIDREMFFRIAGRFARARLRRDGSPEEGSVPSEAGAFGDVLFCGVCGGRMVRSWSAKRLKNGGTVRRYYYRCANTGRLDMSGCGNKSVSEIILKKIVLKALCREFHLSSMKQEEIYLMNRKEFEKEAGYHRNELRRTGSCLARIRLGECELYMNYRKGDVRLAGYLEEKKRYEKEKLAYCKRKTEIQEDIEKIKQKEEEAKLHIRRLCEGQQDMEINEKLIQCFVKRITVYSPKRVTVLFYFCG